MIAAEGREQLRARGIGGRYAPLSLDTDPPFEGRRRLELRADCSAPRQEQGGGLHRVQAVKAEESKPSSKPKPEAGKAPKVVESKPEVYSGGKPGVYYDSILQDVLPELEEVVPWWRKRTQALSNRGVPQPKGQPYILAEDLIAEVPVCVRISRTGTRVYAERRGITVTEAGNQILRRGVLEGYERRAIGGAQPGTKRQGSERAPAS